MYGITKKDLKIYQNKHEVQRDYLENHIIETSTGQVKTLLDVSFSANHSKRYYAELINKINEIYSLVIIEAIDKGFDIEALFLTITLDGYFRDFLYGDFSRYLKTLENPNTDINLIPTNDMYGKLRDKIDRREKFTIKDIYNCLNHQFTRFQNVQLI